MALGAIYDLVYNFMKLNSSIKSILDLPYTITFVLRKRKQYEDLKSLPKEKRPPDPLFWLGNPEDIEKWIDIVLEAPSSDTKLEIDDAEFM